MLPMNPAPRARPAALPGSLRGDLGGNARGDARGKPRGNARDDARSDARGDLRLALVAEPPLVLAGLRANLGGRADCRIVASAASLAALADALGSAAADAGTAVDVLVLDAFDGVDARAAALPDRLADDDAAPRACVVLADADAPALQRWLHAGISVLPRAAPAEQIVAAARAAAAGLVALPPQWLATHAAPLPHASDRLAMLIEPLSARERQVLGKMADGLGNRQIAQVLAISEHTAKFHVAQILGKLQASSRTEAVVKGLRHGLVAAVPVADPPRPRQYAE
jgi:DNA-binding NarL/FixJ family response regulator